MFIELIEAEYGKNETINIDTIKKFYPELPTKEDNASGDRRLTIEFKDGEKRTYYGHYSKMLQLFSDNNLILFTSEEDLNTGIVTFETRRHDRT